MTRRLLALTIAVSLLLTVQAATNSTTTNTTTASNTTATTTTTNTTTTPSTPPATPPAAASNATTTNATNATTNATSNTTATTVVMNATTASTATVMTPMGNLTQLQTAFNQSFLACLAWSPYNYYCSDGFCYSGMQSGLTCSNNFTRDFMNTAFPPTYMASYNINQQASIPLTFQGNNSFVNIQQG